MRTLIRSLGAIALSAALGCSSAPTDPRQPSDDDDGQQPPPPQTAIVDQADTPGLAIHVQLPEAIG